MGSSPVVFLSSSVLVASVAIKSCSSSKVILANPTVKCISSLAVFQENLELWLPLQVYLTLSHIGFDDLYFCYSSQKVIF